MEFITAEKYHDRLFEFTAGMMNELIMSGAIHPADIDYLVTSHHRKGFGDQIARSLRMNGSSQVIDLYESMAIRTPPHYQCVIIAWSATVS